jgi:RHS repeat-associated protein
VGGGSGLLNQSYLQDKNGNVIQREATVGTESLYENFYYDADNRLCAVVLGGTGSCSSSTIVYGGTGNITNQPGVGTYTYPAPGQPQPHAVTSITGTFNGVTNPTFSYDGNGNMTARASSTPNIVWSSYNYPTSISASDATGSEEVQFKYGPDRQRWEQIYTGPSGTEQTYYVGKQLEVVFNGTTTNYRHYIYAGSEPVAVYSRTSAGTNTMSYFLEDHQGGVSSITSNAGASDVGQSWSAFGQMRDSASWSGTPTSTQLSSLSTYTRQGYTFQTWLGQSMGLNHMNGRVEDAILGRFLSPDPHIPDPTNAQSYNRYSYVNNNPLSNIDPTGFVAHKCLGGCASPSPDPVGGGVDGNPGVFTADGAIGAMELAAADTMGLSSSQILTASTTGLTIGGSANPIAAFDQWVSAAAGPAQSQNGNVGSLAFAPTAFVAPEVGVDVAVAVLTCPICVLVGGVLLPNSTASNDTTEDSSQAYVFHFTSAEAAAAILASGQIIPGAISGQIWVTPSPYPTATLAESQLALPATPAGFFAIPAQNLQTPVTWSTAQPKYGQPGGGVEGTTPVAIPIQGAVWVPFPQ